MSAVREETVLNVLQQSKLQQRLLDRVDILQSPDRRKNSMSICCILITASYNNDMQHFLRPFVSTNFELLLQPTPWAIFTLRAQHQNNPIQNHWAQTTSGYSSPGLVRPLSSA